MKINEHSQNLGMRIGTIQIVAFVLLTILGVRLYYLQVVQGEHYMEKAENQRVRLIPFGVSAAGVHGQPFASHTRHSGCVFAR